MVDLHCHLLPGLDDGARTQEMALAMARSAGAAGVHEIVCTPHCTAGDPDLGRRIDAIRRRVKAMNPLLAQQGIPVTLYPGMELLCNRYLPRVLERGEVLTLANSRYLLIEFQFDDSISKMEWAIHQVRQAGYRPVLAHPERYTAVWRTPEQMGDWFFQQVVLQLDKDSVLGRFGRSCARTAAWVLGHGFAHVISSDAHDLDNRTTDLEEVRRYVARQYSPWYADLLVNQNPKRILTDADLVRPEQET